MVQVKQANFIKHGTPISEIDGIAKDTDKKLLWTGLVQDDFEQFRRSNEKLMLCRDGQWFKRMPFRMYVIDDHSSGDGLDEAAPVLQVSSILSVPSECSYPVVIH